MDVALQLWSIKEEVQEDFDSALAMVEKAGYTGVEFAGYQGKTPAELKALLEKHHLKAVGTHAGFERLRDHLEEEFEYAKTLGYTLIICPYMDLSTMDKVMDGAKFLEDAAQKAKAQGLTIAYHNHHQEFEELEGKAILDILFENAPSILWEADVFWISYAGKDPITAITPYQEAGRICSIHAKEMEPGTKANVYVGQGCVDFKGVAGLCSPEKYPYVVEQEEFTSSHEDAITQSCQGLHKALA